MYRLTVDKFVENGNYEKETEEVRKKNEYREPYNHYPMPSKLLPEKALTIDLTDEEFSAVKKAVLGVM